MNNEFLHKKEIAKGFITLANIAAGTLIVGQLVVEQMKTVALGIGVVATIILYLAAYFMLKSIRS